jgi:transcriptional regulator with XRE-family HTH domain
VRAVWINPRDYKIIGQRLEAARKAAGITQVELAKKLGKPQSFVSSYESGGRRIDLLELGRIAQALGRDVHGLFDEIFDRVVPTMRNAKPKPIRKSRKKS